MSATDHWIHRTDAPLDRATVVFDLDGVIADASHRQRHLRDGRRDWDAFFDDCVHDTVLPAGAALAAAVDEGHTVVILTARPDRVVHATVDWLAANGIRHDVLVLRPRGDRRSSADFKRDELATLVAQGAQIVAVVEDSPPNLAMLRDEGYPAVPVASGYYEN